MTGQSAHERLHSRRGWPHQQIALRLLGQVVCEKNCVVHFFLRRHCGQLVQRGVLVVCMHVWLLWQLYVCVHCAGVVVQESACVCLCEHVCTHAFMCARMRACACVRTSVCVCVRECLCFCIRVCACVHVFMC